MTEETEAGAASISEVRVVGDFFVLVIHTRETVFTGVTVPQNGSKLVVQRLSA